MSDAPILFQELSAGSGKLGLVTLNVAATLNSLTLQMVDMKALAKKPFARVAIYKHYTSLLWLPRVAPVITRRVFLRVNTA